MFKEYQDLFKNEELNTVLKYFLDNFSCLGKIKKYKKNEFITFYTGKEIIMFEEGNIDLGLEDFSGKECLLYKILHSGDLIGYMDFFSSNSKSCTIKFRKDTRLRFISKQEMDNFLEEHPEGHSYILRYTIRAYNISLMHLLHNRFYSTEERIIEFLIRISASREPNKNKNILITNYTHQSIGDFTNISRNLVSKILKKLENLGLIKIEFKKILLIDLNRMEQYRESIRK